MKRLLKFTAIMLAFAIISSFGFSASAEGYSRTEEAALLLNKLNILLLNDANDDFSLGKGVTKAEFCIYLARALKMVPNENPVLPFDDVDKDDALAPYIQSLYELDVIHGYNNQLNLDKALTYNEAVKMLVSALGYGDAANERGGYPKGYLQLASELEITQKAPVKNTEALTKAEAAVLIFNMLNAELLEINGIINEQLTYVQNGETALSKIYNIYEGKGRVMKNSFASLESGSYLPPAGSVVIGGYEYLAGETEVEKLLGYDIEFWYQYDEATDASTIILITKGEDSESLYIKSEDIIRFEAGRYVYADESGRTKNANISQDFMVLYNMGYPQSGFSEAMMKPANGGVRLIKGKGSDYEVVMIYNYNSYAVSSVDTSREIIYGKNYTTTNLKGVDYEVLTASGKRTSLSQIKEWSVVSEAWSSDNSSVIIYVSDNVVSGTVSEIDSSENTVTVAGDKYYISPNCYNAGLLVHGKAANFYLDFGGKIAAVDIQLLSGFNYAYFIKANVSEEDELATVKLFNAKGEIVKVRLAEKPKINGIRNTDHNLIAANLNGLAEKLIQYELNSDNEIKEIYTYDGASKDYIHKLSSGKSIWNTKQRTFGGKVTVEADTPVFVIPTGAAPEDYEIKTLSTFTNDTTYNVSVYTTGDNVYGEVIIFDTSSKSYQRKAAVITSVTNFLNAEDEPAIKVELIQNGVKAEYELYKPELLGSIERGDIVKINVNNKNEIDGLLHIYDKSADRLCVTNPYEPQTGAGYRSRNRIYMGYAYIREDGLLKFHKEAPTKDNLYTQDTENALLSAFTIYVLDTEAATAEDMVYVGSENDIVDFLHGQGGCSRIIVSTNWADPEEIIVIK